MGFGLEVDMIRAAHEQDLLTAPYVFDPDQATDMARAGADVLVPHMGLTTGGAIGAETAKTLDDCVGLIQAMHDAAKRVNPEILVLCHGGPIAEPDDAPTCSSARRAWRASSAPARWSGCPPRSR